MSAQCLVWDVRYFYNLQLSFYESLRRYGSHRGCSLINIEIRHWISNETRHSWMTAIKATWWECSCRGFRHPDICVVSLKVFGKMIDASNPPNVLLKCTSISLKASFIQAAVIRGKALIWTGSGVVTLKEPHISFRGWWRPKLSECLDLVSPGRHKWTIMLLLNCCRREEAAVA